MKFKSLTKENLQKVFGKKSERAISLFESKNFEDLETLLQAECQVAQGRAELLSLMYSEVMASNIQSCVNTEEEDIYEEP